MRADGGALIATTAATPVTTTTRRRFVIGRGSSVGVESESEKQAELKSQSQMRKSQLRARVAKENVVWAFQRLGKFLIVELENFIIHLSHLLNQVLVLVTLTPREQQLYSAFVALQRFLAASMQ